MKLVYINPNPSGAYPSIQNCNLSSIPDGMAVWPENLDAAEFYAHNGFVNLIIEDVNGVPTVTACTPNTELWEAWKAAQPAPEPAPDPEPTTEERVTALEETTAQQGEILDILLSGETEAST